MIAYTVDELVDQCRASIDEFNEESITDSQITDALNRAQKAITRILTRKIDTIFLDTYDVTTTAGTNTYDMPSDIFARKIEKVEHVDSNGFVYRVQHISYKNRHGYMGDGQSSYPFYYDIIGTEFRLYPTPDGGLTIRLHYSKTPERLVMQQGQVNSVSVANNYIVVDSLGSSLTTDTTSRNAYVNIVDYVTGEVKVSLQVANIATATKKITFKASGLTRSTVFGKTIATAIPSTVAEDDYICLIQGSCIPQLPSAYDDFLIQHAVVHLKRRFGEVSEEEYAALKDIEMNIKKDMTGREQYQRIRKANGSWDRKRIIK